MKERITPFDAIVFIWIALYVGQQEDADWVTVGVSMTFAVVVIALYYDLKKKPTTPKKTEHTS